jgi:hypothetical protein
MINLVKIYPHVFFTLMCLLTVASTLTTTYSSINTLKQLSWGVMSLFSVIIISLIIRYFSKIAKIKRSYNSEAFNIEPSLCNMILDLAKQMKVKLDTKCQLVFKKGLNNAR